jgi:V/A-type H+-transporting ATPase subunit C
VREWLSRLKAKVPRDYPYAYARVSAKRAKLLESREYENMLKMELNEIARALQDGDYSREVERYGDSHSGLDLVERAVEENLSNTMKKLVEVSSSNLEHVLRTYLRKYDVEAVKRAVRGEEADSLSPVSSLTREDVEELRGMENGELKDSLRIYDTAVDYSSFIDSEMSDAEIESALDRAYAEDLKALKGNGHPRFERFIDSIVRHRSLLSALRLNRYGEDPRSIEVPEWLDGSLDGAALEEVAEREDVAAHSIEELERELERKRLREALELMHSEPLSAGSVLGYAVAKEVEAKNIRTIARGKDVGMKPEQIREELVVDE